MCNLRKWFHEKIVGHEWRLVMGGYTLQCGKCGKSKWSGKKL